MKCKHPNKFKAVSEDAAFGCGRCMPCRYNIRRIKTHRLMLEAELHPHNAFLTCTYRDEDLPSGFVHPKTGQVFAPNSVNPEEHRLFINRLRSAYRRVFGERFRMYGVGEYGEKNGRPHYHYALFNFPTCVYRGYRFQGSRFEPCKCDLCRFVSDVWGKGNIFIGSLERESAQYICGYVTKKMTSDNSDFQSNYLLGRHPEFARMSNRPGIARNYVDIIADLLTANGVTDIDELPRVLLHGQKALPLGRYMMDKLYERLGITFKDGDRLRAYEKSLRALFSDPSIDPQIIQASSQSLSIALQMLNAQSAINFEAQVKLFSKGGSQ